MTRCSVIGAAGFVGSVVVEQLRAKGGFEVKAVVRQAVPRFLPGVEVCSGFELAAGTDWSPVVSRSDCVILAAGRAHVMHEPDAFALDRFRQVNVAGTLNLARQSAEAGVRRFVFVSSIKVNGEETMPGQAFTPFDEPAPADSYAVSKLEAEYALRQLATTTRMEVVIIRPPLVYGPGVKGNFLNMMHWLHSGVPLPLGAIHNKRSLVSVDNLADLVVACVQHKAAANRLFLVSDGEDVSTTRLLQLMGRAMGTPVRLLPIPARIFSTGAALIGKRSLSRRLCCSLQVDMLDTMKLLDWVPPVNILDGLTSTAKYYLAERMRK